MSIHIDIKDLHIGNVTLDTGDTLIVSVLRHEQPLPEILFTWKVTDERPKYKLTIKDV
jgi:hypothetical protein